ncbi:MAG: FtsX-like permease family protein [Bryobacteraceae bacterium]
MTPLGRKLLGDLGHMRGQVVAVSLVVACGIASYVTMQSAYFSLVEVKTNYYSAYRMAHVFARVKRAPESLVPAIEAIPGVASAQTGIVMDVTLDVPGLDEPATGRLVSIPPRRIPMLNDLFIRTGRYVEPGQRDEVLVSETFAEANALTLGATLSAVINGKWERLRVTGTALSPEYVYEVRPGEVFPDNRRFGILWIARDGIAPALNMDGAFNSLAVSLTREANEQQVISQLDRILEPYGSLGAYGRGDHTSWRIVDDHIKEIETSGVILPAIFLSIVAFLLHILMSRLVNTQRGQIAVMKAFGYRNTEIGWHYLKLALVAVIAGTIVGIAVGLWLGAALTSLFARYFRFPSLELHFDPRVMLLASGISGIAACFGALSAVRHAVSLAPAEAMRPEPPARFQAGFLERTSLRVLLSPATRMIVRNLDRRRMRVFLSSLAVAFSVAILVIAWYRIDAVNQMADVQFHHLQLEDVTVNFHEPRPSSVVHAIAHLPGVLRVEPFRSAPVRIRFGHRSRLTAISGLVRDGQLRHPHDSALRPIELPPEGLLLNSRLAEILGAKPGDLVTVEVLEGSRRKGRIPVTSVSDEPVGLNAYMDTSALARFLREGQTVSGVFLTVDPTLAPALYAKLKRTPAVSGVAVREVMLASFWKTIGESINSTTAVLVVFACVIAFGIVYNGARIALSERGNELAALRVLGFTKGEIGRILLGEQALLTLVAVPGGFALGYGLSWWVATTHSPDLLRLPFVVNPATYTLSALVVLLAALASGLLVARRLQRMDLTAVLKSRE